MHFPLRHPVQQVERAWVAAGGAVVEELEVHGEEAKVVHAVGLQVHAEATEEEVDVEVEVAPVEVMRRHLLHADSSEQQATVRACDCRPHASVLADSDPRQAGQESAEPLQAEIFQPPLFAILQTDLADLRRATTAVARCWRLSLYRGALEVAYMEAQCYKHSNADRASPWCCAWSWGPRRDAA